MSPELNTLLGLLIVGAIVALIGRAFTATSRRRGEMQALAQTLRSSFEARANDVLDHYAGFVTTQSTTRPEVFNLLTLEHEGVSLCVFDLFYSEMIRLGDRTSEVDRKRTVIALSHPEMNLPQFLIRPETGGDKIRGLFEAGQFVVESSTEKEQEVPSDPIPGLSIHISRPPSFGDWLNKSEIQLADRDTFNRAYWIQGSDERALQAFLTEPMTHFIDQATTGHLVWEGFGNTLILASNYNLLNIKRLPDSISLAHTFMQLSLDPGHTRASGDL